MRHRQALLLLCGLCAAVGLLKADQEQHGDEDVLVLTTDTFTEQIERLDSPALVQFLIPDCKACVAMAPDYKKVASNLKGIATVAVVDCTNVDSVRTCRSYAAHSFPKILLFKPGTRINPYTGGALKDTEEYKGKLSARDLAAAVTNLLDDTHIMKLNNTEEHDKFLQQQPKLAKVLLFTDKNASTVLYKGLSWAYAKRLVCAEVHAAGSGQLAERYEVENLPSLLVIKPDGSHEAYTGPLKALPLREFLDRHASSETGHGGAAGGAAGPEGLLEPELHSLTADNLTDIDSKADMWLVAFYAATGEQSCAAQVEEYKALLLEIQGIVSFGLCNAAHLGAEQQMQYKLDGDALQSAGCQLQLVLLPWGANKAAKREYLRWTGNTRNAKQLQEWILAQVPDFTAHLTNEMEGQQFLAATAADLPHAAVASAADRQGPVGKVFLFTTKQEVPGIYKALAMQFYTTARLLFCWTTPDNKGPGYPLMQKMNIRKAPAMSILFPLPAKPVGDADMADLEGPKEDMAIQQYLGPLKYQKMLMWLQAMAQLTGMAYRSHAGSTPPPTPDHFEVRSQAQLRETCYDKHSLCMIVMVDGRSDVVNKYKDITKKAATALQGNPLTWVVVDVSQQRDFRSAYGFTADQLPALVALSTKRMRFAQGAAPFDEHNAKQLVTKVLAGSAVTLPLPILPQLVDGGQPEEEEPTDGAADEFDLQDILAEEVTAPIPSKEEQLRQAEKELQEQAVAAAGKKKKLSKKKSKRTKKSGTGSKKSKKQPGSSSAKDEL